MDEHGYAVDDETGSEMEVREFLTALVRVVKPSLVVETGCYKGGGTIALAYGLKLNGSGTLVTCDTLLAHCNATDKKLRTCGLSALSSVHWCRGDDLNELRHADLVFLDSDYANRKPEYDLVKPGAMVVVHDALKSYDPEVEPHARWVREEGGVVINTYRGLGVVVKGSGGSR